MSPICPICSSLGRKAMHTQSWECSHVHCPVRKSEPQLDAARQMTAAPNTASSLVDIGTGGCYRVEPTTKD